MIPYNSPLQSSSFVLRLGAASAASGRLRQEDASKKAGSSHHGKPTCICRKKGGAYQAFANAMLAGVTGAGKSEQSLFRRCSCDCSDAPKQSAQGFVVYVVGQLYSGAERKCIGDCLVVNCYCRKLRISDLYRFQETCEALRTETSFNLKPSRELIHFCNAVVAFVSRTRRTRIHTAHRSWGLGFGIVQAFPARGLGLLSFCFLPLHMPAPDFKTKYR